MLMNNEYNETSHTSDGNEAIPLLQVCQGCGGVGRDRLYADVDCIPLAGRDMSERHPHAATWPFDNLRLVDTCNKRKLNNEDQH